jgi:carbonic anhydrase
MSWLSNAPAPKVNIRPRFCLLVLTRGLRLRRSWTLRIGDIFNSRVAGNVENPDILGSMEFDCKLAGAKVVLVMGHTACGAIKGAIDDAELGNLTGLLAKIKPAVAATTYTGERTSKNYAFVDAVARKNVENTMANIRNGSPVLTEMESSGAIKNRRCDV